MNANYAIVTPVKNEEKLLPQTIDSVIKQTIKPKKWVIINDGSTDRTGEIIKEMAAKYDWISTINFFNEKTKYSRRMGGQAVVHLGLEKINCKEYDFIVRMDADLSFQPSFFAKIFEKFDDNDKLGIASGVCFVEEKGKLVEEKHPRFHTRGPLKVYRSICFQDIGGLDPEEGWDTIDEVKANMRGWQTWSFPDLKVIHLRKTQTASGILKGKRNKGRTAYYTGYHPLFAAVRSIKSMFERPFLIGGIHMMIGYLEGYVKRLPVVDDRAFIKFIRQQQLNKLLGKKSIWH